MMIVMMELEFWNNLSGMGLGSTTANLHIAQDAAKVMEVAGAMVMMKM